MKKKIAVISDTHGTLRPQVIETLKDADAVLHCGDIASDKARDALNEICDITYVRGNCDRNLEDIPEERLLDLFGKKIYMVHNKKDISSLAEEADIILYGHSHKYELIEDDKIHLNPGSAGPRRFGRPVSMAVLEVDPETGKIEINRIDLES